MDRLKDFLRISEAAEYLGVSPNTLRNWENAGKIAAYRHPVNGYRLFKQEELDALLLPVQSEEHTQPNGSTNENTGGSGKISNTTKKPR